MADYSGYTIKRTHSLAPLTSVHEAVAADGRPGRFALKIFHPPASTNVRRFYAIEGWLLAAERQQQQAKKDGTVVEVLACGRCEEGAFAIIPWQERPLEPMIKTLGAKGDTLRALAECLLNTIEQWEAETGGPHGNLKPANIFLGRTGPLVGMTAQLSDPAFLPGAKIEALRQADLAAVGTMLATIVRRRLPGAWPIEEAPEWKALGNGGKGWLAFCNYLLNPSPKEGELTIAEARKHLRKVPKDANPVKTAALTLAAVLVLGLVSVVAFARFGNPIYMPDQVFRLAQKVGNPQIKREATPAWIELCMAWDSWLLDLQSNGPRLLKTDDLWEQNDDRFRKELADFMKSAQDLLPAALVRVPEAANEKRLGVLAKSPPEAVLDEMVVPSVSTQIDLAAGRIRTLRGSLESWPRWNQLRDLKRLMDQKTFTSTAAELQKRLPPQRGDTNYQAYDPARTLKYFNDLSLDNTGALPLAGRWSEISHLQADMEASGAEGDRIQKDMPELILNRLADRSSLSDFADSLMSPLEEMRLYRKQFLDPQVVRERFLKESPLLKETTAVTADDFERWVRELVEFTLVPKTEKDDPRLAATLSATVAQLPQTAGGLEPDAPAAEPGGLATLSEPDFKREFDGLTAGLKALRDRPIVNRDLPAIRVETSQVAGAFDVLKERVTITLTLLKPEVWLAKVAQAYGNFAETKRRWAAWQQATLPGVTPASLTGETNRLRFRELRRRERVIKDWIAGLEGPTGFAALAVPDLATVSEATSTELKRLEVVRREQRVTEVATKAAWNGVLPTVLWAATPADVRKPLEEHRTWLAALPDFAKALDELSALLLAGFGWGDGVRDVTGRLDQYPGVSDLTGRPGEWNAEARQLQRLEGVSDQNGLTTAAQSGGLSRKLMAWRGLGRLAGWPAGPKDFDLDGGVVKAMREFIGRDVTEAARRDGLLDELASGTRVRFNRAAHAASRDEKQLSAMFERMEPVGVAKTDLDDPVAYNHALWEFKGSDWNESNLDRLRDRRNRFVEAVGTLGKIPAPAQPGVRELVGKLEAIELKEQDPNRARTPSPGQFGWKEDLTDHGLGLKATWKSGARIVSLEFSVVQPDDAPAFYLARRVIAVGEFMDLMKGRPNDWEAVKQAMPVWAQTETSALPRDMPIGWWPSSDFKGVELNPLWIFKPGAPVRGLLNNPDARASSPALEQALTEKPTLKSPLQQVTPSAAKVFAEKVLGARLPTPKEWQAALQMVGKPAQGHFRGPNFQKLFNFLTDYKEGGVPVLWRPSEGVFYPSKTDKDREDGQASATTDESRLWFREVDDGPRSKDFINLTGNISIFLSDNAATRPQFYVAGGSVLSPPGIDFTQPQKIEAGGGLIGGRAGTEAYSDVGIRPAFDAPPGFKERYKLYRLVQDQKYLTL